MKAFGRLFAIAMLFCAGIWGGLGMAAGSMKFVIMNFSAIVLLCAAGIGLYYFGVI